MKDNILQDVVPPAQKRSIRDIPLPENRKRVAKPSQQKRVDISGIKPATKPEELEAENFNNQIPNQEDFSKKYGTDGDNFKKWGIIGGGVVLLIATFLILNSFHSGTLAIEPKTVNSNVNKNLEISNLNEIPESELLSYRIIELAGEVEKTVEANDEETVQEKSSGMITVYNNYSSSDQKLIKNTRFESDKGLIYRIQESVSVPGYTKDSDDNVVPGELTVQVFADEAGEEYNIQSTTFTIPGFKGQEPYDFFSAETKDSISGGFDGVRKIITQDAIDSATKELTSSLTNKLIEEVNNQITEDFILVYDSNSFTFGTVDQEDISGKNESNLKLKGKIEAYIFNKILLSNKIAEESVPGYQSEENILISDFESLTLNLIRNSEIETLQINGNTDLVWQNNEEELKKSLSGTKKSELNSVLKNYSGISKAESVIKPFWRTSFPDSADNIKIEIE